MYEISVIVPMYNAEKYIKEAIDSVCCQTIGFEGLQLILVDDASKDNTSAIAQEYATKYDNINYLRLDGKSGSAGKTRNEGFNLVKGKYIMYLDADDRLEQNACEILYKTIEEKEADCVIANYRNMDENGKVWEEAVLNVEKYEDFEINMRDYEKSFHVLNSAVWNKIYKTDFIREKQIKFLEGVTAEDAYFCIQCFLEANKIYYCNQVVYQYRMRNKGDLSVSNECNMVYFDKYNQGYEAIYHQFEKYENKEFFRFFFTKTILFILYKFIDSTLLSKEERIKVLQKMHWLFLLIKEEKVIITEDFIMQIVNSIQEEKYEEAIYLCDFLAKIRRNLPKEVNARMEQQDSKKYKGAILLEKLQSEPKETF